MTYSSPRIPFLAGNYPTDEDRRSQGGQPIVVKRTPSIEPLRNVVVNYKDFIDSQKKITILEMNDKKKTKKK